MYNPRFNRVDGTADVHDLIDAARFGHLISATGAAIDATGLPWLLDRDEGEFGTLRGHFARANDHWKLLDGATAMVLFPLADGYVTPSRYVSKAEHHKVVPTWNYEVVHAHGTVHIHDDPEWARALVSDLTERHESSRTAIDGAPRWAVTDAPADFIDGQLRAIVGVSMTITRLDGKRKLSQNRSDGDRLGVISELDASDAPSDQELAAAMRDVLESGVS